MLALRSPRFGQQRRCRIALIGLAALTLSACTTVLARAPAPEAGLETARPYGIASPFLREWGDSISPEKIDGYIRIRADQIRRAAPQAVTAGKTIVSESLALSGGGPDGAFGAGVLAGWSARGDRPRFTFVSGVSTGAIIAVFTFLGPEYDATLKQLYTSFGTDDLATQTIFTGLTGGTALADSDGLRRLIARFIDSKVMARIAEAYGAGRLLLIGTTNLDASRPVVWNIGEIAASGHPDALRLIHDIIAASSAIPAVFPPVLIPVEIDGERFDEMHVDGGATQQVTILSPQFRRADLARAIGAPLDQRLHVIINNKLRKPYEPVSPRLSAIAAKALSSLIGGSGGGDVYRIYSVAERDGVELNLAWIPAEVTIESNEPFDTVYMSKLYEIGFKLSFSGEAWRREPPDLAPSP